MESIQPFLDILTSPETWGLVQAIIVSLVLVFLAKDFPNFVEWAGKNINAFVNIAVSKARDSSSQSFYILLENIVYTVVRALEQESVKQGISRTATELKREAIARVRNQLQVYGFSTDNIQLISDAIESALAQGIHLLYKPWNVNDNRAEAQSTASCEREDCGLNVTSE